jgi:hypothetical protein
MELMKRLGTFGEAWSQQKGVTTKAAAEIA